MSRPLPLLYAATALSLSPLLLSMIGWGGPPRALFAVVGWFGLVVAAGVGLRWPDTSAVVGIAPAVAVWVGLVEDVGQHFIFRPSDGPLYFVLVLPALLAISSAGYALAVLFRERLGARTAHRVATAGVVGLLAVLPVLFAHRSFPKTFFASFDSDTGNGAEMAVMPQPFDNRAFIVPVTSREVIRAVEAANPDTSIGLYMNNARFTVEYDFGRLRSVTLVGLEDARLDGPVTWPAGEIRGDLTFLAP
jgi:hypothetical protein